MKLKRKEIKNNNNNNKIPVSFAVADGSRDVEKVKLNVKLDGVSLNRVSSTKFWGIIIDENLTWKNHMDAITKTISRSWNVDKA